MQFFEAVKSVFSKYATFEGRARRSEYWYFYLFYWIVTVVLAVIPYMVVAAGLFMLATLIPMLAVCCRRLHDVGKSGLWCLISFVPLVGSILLIVWLVGDGQPGVNAYGPNPKEAGNRQARPVSPAPGAAPGSLSVLCVSGPMQGQSFQIGGHGLYFGRTADCAVRFPDGTPGVSGRHCCLSWGQGGLLITDLGSRHGTFLGDGCQLMPNNSESIAPGTRFSLGSSSILFQVEPYRG